MRTHRFGRKIKLPATIALKHQIRVLISRGEVERIEPQGSSEVLREQPLSDEAASRSVRHG